MICVRLEGGIGNQLYQYSAGRALSLRIGTDLLLDISALRMQKSGVTPRNFELSFFNISGHIVSPIECIDPNSFRYFPILSRVFCPWSLYVEKPDGYDVRFQCLTDQTYLRGYWQNPRYFEDITRILYDEITPRNPLSILSYEIIDQISEASSSAVAVHVRRGDYVSLLSASSYHGVLPLSYYSSALQKVRENVCKPRFFVFSDDIDWCRKNLPVKSNETVFVTHNTGSDSWQDLVLMSRCNHHIIANSTFSWWGAWLADNYNKHPRLVFAPSRWFAGRIQTELYDRFPAHWILL